MPRKENCLNNSHTECLFSVIKRKFWFGEENKFKTALEEIYFIL